MKVHNLFTELSSEKRLSLLQALDKSPATFTSLNKEVDMASAETSRQLSKLTENQLIEKKGDGNYYITFFGKLVLSSISQLEFISDKSDYFVSHDTSFIPSHLLCRLDELSKGEFVTGVYKILEKMETFVEEEHEYHWFMGEDFPRHLSPIMRKKAEEKGWDKKSILPEDVFITLRDNWVGEKPKNINNQLKLLDKVNMLINVTNVIAFFSLPGHDGKIDNDVVIMGNDPVFKNWCRELFEYYWEKAKPISL